MVRLLSTSQVQSLMDDLDLPPDRANLFEVIDADAGQRCSTMFLLVILKTT